jgi:putative endonuclease
VSARGWSVYIVVCGDESLYVGLSSDVDARVGAHNAGRGARYTRSRTPVLLRWHWRCANSEDARRLEGLLKKLTRAAKFRVIAGHAAALGPLLCEVARRRRQPNTQKPVATTLR